MADSTVSFDNAEPMDNMSLEDAMEMASNDDQDDYIEATTLVEAHNSQDEEFKLDSYNSLSLELDDDDDDDTGDYEDSPFGKKRKRVGTGASKTDMNHSQQTNARIKAEGGETFILDESTSHMAQQQQNDRVIGTFGRRSRQKGESLPAYHKKVSAQLDSDDELILQMREKGYSDRQIADKLAKDGRVRYDQKSISTRIMRIRLAQAENFDFLLREGYREWEFDDDQRLVQAYALADIEISYEIERVRAWRFRKVSEYMRRLDKESLFSANACRIRYGELIQGTARIPCDVDDDPDTRREELRIFRLSREVAREKETAENETKEAMEKRVKDATKVKNAQKAEEIANKRAAKEADKAQRAMQRAAQAQLRMHKAAENQKAKTERNAQIKKAASVPKKRGIHNKAKPDVAAEASNQPSTKTKEETEPVDPRSYLNMTDLTKLCANHGLSTDKTKKELVASLVDADMEWTHDQLRKMCKAKGLNAGGSKAVMRYQLALKAAQTCPSFKAGMKAADDGDEKGGDEMMVGTE
ncbi:uncharacterized protein EKO05_0004660 [Ascochyta rabiei]|uniref:DUF7626 domain-containing protein n=1 Tax=Didymella rabiei TaxID=5454 RepID=A0A163KQU4_DIDRA|nr:uncharacterized protein EKO05_0004660 [Ascochyta rabiei]KZM27180.1 hypothetical protein ST47_g1705 [Ascochyta rabiei]UPX14170.1 hypothetical protein EKO05_0004660 [Ascochyta rabiei]